MIDHLELRPGFQGAFEIANYDMSRLLVEKMHSDVSEVQKLIFAILHNIMQYKEICQDILLTPAMSHLTEYLESNDEEVQSACARCVGDMAVEAEGKTQANATGTVEVLVNMILDDDLGSPLAPATYAMMMYAFLASHRHGRI